MFVSRQSHAVSVARAEHVSERLLRRLNATSEAAVRAAAAYMSRMWHGRRRAEAAGRAGHFCQLVHTCHTACKQTSQLVSQRCPPRAAWTGPRLQLQEAQMGGSRAVPATTVLHTRAMMLTTALTVSTSTLHPWTASPMTTPEPLQTRRLAATSPHTTWPSTR